MFNYANLSDVEFENLCKDVMSRMIGSELYRFAKGRDGGIDFTDDTLTHNIVVQVKHYIRSSTSNLIASIRKEIPKIETLNPNKYFICCSKELTPNNVAEIRRMFPKYMDSDKYIVTLSIIDDFLSQPSNSDIVMLHYKLWLSSITIIDEMFTRDISIDSDVLIYKIKNDMKYFVETGAFHRAIECLNKSKSIFIIGLMAHQTRKALHLQHF